jgi:hypothetical protein
MGWQNGRLARTAPIHGLPLSCKEPFRQLHMTSASLPVSGAHSVLLPPPLQRLGDKAISASAQRKSQYDLIRRSVLGSAPWGNLRGTRTPADLLRCGLHGHGVLLRPCEANDRGLLDRLVGRLIPSVWLCGTATAFAFVFAGGLPDLIVLTIHIGRCRSSAVMGRWICSGCPGGMQASSLARAFIIFKSRACGA